ncbi:hypothetical protein GCM10027059_15510 [Myceligenerans halotolerans]
MTESYEAPSGDGGWHADEQAFAGALVVGGGRAEHPGADLGSAGVEQSPEAVVGQVLTALDGLDELPPAEHVQRFEQVHGALRAHLSGDA